MNNKQALNLFKTHMVLGPDYHRERGPKPVLPKSIVQEIMQYAQYEDWMKTANDLASFLCWNHLFFITQSEAWAQDPSLDEAKKWLTNPEKPSITESYEFYTKSIVPLIKFIANSPLVDADGWTALMHAAEIGHTEAFFALLAEPGIDVNAANKKGWTVLFYAAFNGHTKTVKALLKVPGINVNAKSNVGSTALMWAAFNGHTKAVKALLATPGIDVTAVSRANMTALNWATRNGHIEVVRLINEHLAQSEHSNQNKPTLN